MSQLTGKLSQNQDSIVIDSEQTGLTYVYNLSRTVNIYENMTGCEVDVMSVMDTITRERLIELIAERENEIAWLDAHH